MARYIDADLLVENISKIEDLRTLSTKTVGIAISATPTADVVEVKHEKWRKKRDDYDCEYIVCSCCKEEFYPPENEFVFDKLPKYCSECGAKMDGERK